MDISINLNKAEKWKEDVNRLTEEIQAILLRIRTVVQEVAERDHGHLNGGFREVSHALENAFDRLVYAFKKAVQMLDEILKYTGSKVQDIASDIINAAKRIRNG